MDDRVSCHQVTEDEKPVDKSNMQSLFKKMLIKVEQKEPYLAYTRILKMTAFNIQVEKRLFVLRRRKEGCSHQSYSIWYSKFKPMQ